MCVYVVYEMFYNYYHLPNSFRESKSFSERCELSRELISQYPHCVPVIVERASDENKLPLIDKKQYLVPHEMNFGTFFFTIRKRLASTSPLTTGSLGIWIYAGKNPITTHSSKMSEIYHLYKDMDGFLYLKYKGENAFGSDET